LSVARAAKTGQLSIDNLTSLLPISPEIAANFVFADHPDVYTNECMTAYASNPGFRQVWHVIQTCNRLFIHDDITYWATHPLGFQLLYRYIK
jgi:hypothetical protein